MNKIEDYANVALIGLVGIMIIPLVLFLLPFSLIGYIICKLFKIDADDIVNMKDTYYE